MVRTVRMLKKVDRFGQPGAAAALREREGYATGCARSVLAVKRVVAQLQARGMKSPYLRTYVVRAHQSRALFHKAKAGDKSPAMPIGQALVRMMAAVKKFDVSKVNLGDLAFVAAGAEAAE